MKVAGSVDNQLSARFFRSILGHAPIGAYYQRFFATWIPFTFRTACHCSETDTLQTREDIIHYCPLYIKYRTAHGLTGINEHLRFLSVNPAAFAFLGEDQMPDIPYTTYHRGRPLHPDPDEYAMIGETNPIVSISSVINTMTGDQTQIPPHYLDYMYQNYPHLMCTYQQPWLDRMIWNVQNMQHCLLI